jgi:hypothetical protein
MPVDDLELYEETTFGTLLVSDVWLGEATGREVLDRLSIEGAPLGTLVVTWNFLSPPEATAPSQGDSSGFSREKAAFLRLLPDLKQRYPGKFVAVHGGTVVDTDASSAALVRRFFQKFGETSVYVGYVGGRRIIRNISPRLRRS